MSDNIATITAAADKVEAALSRHKICPRCGERKALDDFPPAPSRPDGVTSYCRPCHRVNMQSIRATDAGRTASVLAARKYREKKRRERAASS